MEACASEMAPEDTTPPPSGGPSVGGGGGGESVEEVPRSVAPEMGVLGSALGSSATSFMLS